MFSRPNVETACGMFTLPHIISLILCIGLIIFALYLSRRLDDKKVTLITRIMAVVFTVWEACKIIFKFAIGDTSPDHWVPLYFCSLFIYATIFCGFFKGSVCKLGEAFIFGGCILSGFSFLVVPSTSLTEYPVYHFLSIHSMLFHSCMVYLGILYITKKGIELNKADYKRYAIFVGAFMSLALILNLILKQNFMLMMNPYNIPIGFVNSIANRLPWLYTVIVIGLYFTLPFFVVTLVILVIKRTQKR